jgi:prepilin-type N-terminal cleavage/methylation domain-containing protein
MRREQGFSLVELLVAMSIGMIVLLAALTVLDRGFQLQKESQDRTDAAQQGRLAMERVTRALRSEVAICPAKSALSSATASSLTFTVDYSGGTTPERRTITYDSTTKTLVETSYKSPAGPPYTFPGSPTTTRVLLNNVVQDGGNTIFTYKADSGLGTGANSIMVPPLSADQMAATAQVDVAFTARPAGKASNDKLATTLNSSVFVRNADPLKRDPNPTCL